MTNPLIEKAEEVIWGEVEDTYRAVRALVISEMRWRIWTGVVWELRAHAQSKAKEHCSLEAFYKAHSDHLSVKRLSDHHGKISRRYRQASLACID